MGRPLDVKFQPSDEELVVRSLKRKVESLPIDSDIILELDLYKWEPWDLPVLANGHGQDCSWYFFCPLSSKFLFTPAVFRRWRATNAGYWKFARKDRDVIAGQQVVGFKKTLVFYLGRAPHAQKTDWVMHEYRLHEEEREKFLQNPFVLCRVFKKMSPRRRSQEECLPAASVDDYSADKNTEQISKSLPSSILNPPEKKEPRQEEQAPSPATANLEQPEVMLPYMLKPDYDSAQADFASHGGMEEYKK